MRVSFGRIVVQRDARGVLVLSASAEPFAAGDRVVAIGKRPIASLADIPAAGPYELVIEHREQRVVTVKR